MGEALLYVRVQTAHARSRIVPRPMPMRIIIICATRSSANLIIANLQLAPRLHHVSDEPMLPRCLRSTSSRLLRLNRTGATPATQQPQQCRAASSDPAQYFHYTRAVFGSLPRSFVAESLRHEEPEDVIDLQKAARDHEFYMSAVKKLVAHTVQIPADEAFPDMVFVEDPAVVHDGRALITKMGPASRAGEVTLMRRVLEEMGLDILTVDDPEATIDGGDVLFTGREFLVGLSERTNKVKVIDREKGLGRAINVRTLITNRGQVSTCYIHTRLVHVVLLTLLQFMYARTA